MKPKPKLKVFLAFALAPLVAGIALSIFFNIMTFAAFVEDPSRMKQMRSGENLMAFVVYPIAAEIMFLIPLLLAALLVVLLKLPRTAKGCLSSGFIGGAAAVAWLGGLLSLLKHTGPHDIPVSASGYASVFVALAAACAVVSCFALPRLQPLAPAQA